MTITAKETAIELVEKYYYIKFLQEFGGMDYELAKQCAIIAVDEIIDTLSKYTGMHDQEFFDADVKFYEQVKTEINNL